MNWYDSYPDIFKEVLSKIFKEGKFFTNYEKERYIISDNGVKITIKVLEDSLCIQKIEGNNIFPYLKNQKCADAIIIQKVELTENIYNIHIFELSRNCKNKKDDILMQQLEGACLRALAILSYFKEIKLNKVLLYFASKEIDTDPINYKHKISDKKIEFPYEKDYKDIDNNSKCIFEESNLKIKLLKDSNEYDITDINSEYEITLDKNISHLIYN